MPIDEIPSAATDAAADTRILHAPTTRRTMLKGAAATGLTAATAGVVADLLFAAPASAATSANTSEGDLVAHVRDARSGQIDLYVGTRHVSVRDRSLAAHLARAAR